MRFDSAERFYGGQTGLKPHISNEIAYVESPMWNSLRSGPHFFVFTTNIEIMKILTVNSHLSRTYDLSVNGYSELILYDLSRCTT